MGPSQSKTASVLISRAPKVPKAPKIPHPQRSAPASYYRGGTSRALMFPKSSLPSPSPSSASTLSASFLQEQWAPIFRSCINSPDPDNGRQLDGLGGGISSLSKICVVSSPSSLGADVADVDYTFAAVGVRDDEVDFSSNCGNMTAAIGPFAIDAGLTDAVLEDYYGEIEGGGAWGEACVRIHNTNTGKIIHARFPIVRAGKGEIKGRRPFEAIAEGAFAIDGVAGTGARIRLDFINPAGSKTGKLLPTGNIIDQFGGIEASCVDVGNPAVFVRTRDLLGNDKTLTPDEIDQDSTLLKKLDSIRRQAGVKMGLADTPNEIPGSIPKISMVNSPTTCTVGSGKIQQKEEVDITIRALSVGQPHRAIPITMALAVAATAKLENSIIHQALAKGNFADPEGITIGHAGGKIVVGATFNEKQHLESATVYRTARRLMEGRVYWKA